ncbi:MAG: molybdopterin-dependent oxidoreductase alpha subunit [Arcticibacterium sp.]
MNKNDNALKSKSYVGGWKSIFYSLHVLQEAGLGSIARTITSKNTCKTCAYGMGGQKGGMVNEANDKIEICKKSLQAHITDIQEPIPQKFWQENTIPDLRKLRPRELEKLGRLQQPLLKEKGAEHYTPIPWEIALDKISEKFKASKPNNTFFYSSGRSGNEAAFLLHLFARIYGTNNVNNCSYYCHQASGVGMGSTLGTGTATIQLSDLKKTDLVFVIGANPASNHPRFLTELMHCRRRSGKVVVINPAKEAGLVNFSIPSDVRSLFSRGSDIASHYLQPKIGGDMAVIYGISKSLIEKNGLNELFIEKCTEGFDNFKNLIIKLSWEEIEAGSGISKSQITEVAEVYRSAENVVFSWAMGITHHKHGSENVEAIVNLAMLRGMLGRTNAGLLPLRGHSNVQGIGSVGVTPALKQKVFENIENHLAVKLPTTAGWDTIKCMQEASEGNVDVAFLLGGNLYASNPNLNFAEKALNNIPFKVFLNTTLNEGHINGVDGEVIVLPVLTRDEEKQATTQESMFNYMRMSDGGINRLRDVLSEVEIISTIASKVIDKAVLDFSKFTSHQNIREVIGSVIPGFEKLKEIDLTKEEFQIEGRTFHTPEFNTPSGKAKFICNALPKIELAPNGLSLMSVRSEGQFNSIIYEEEDAWRGTKHRDVLLMNIEDMKARSIAEGERINIKSKTGILQNFEALSFDISKGSTMGFYPETNVLVSSDNDPRSLTPAFKNTEIWIETMA